MARGDALRRKNLNELKRMKTVRDQADAEIAKAKGPPQNAAERAYQKAQEDIRKRAQDAVDEIERALSALL